MAKSVTGKVRSNNQDCYHIPLGKENEPMLFVVSDGMGGTRGGEVASTLSTSAFVTFIQSNSEQEDKALLLRRGAARANTEVYRAARADVRFKDMGTTMTAALVEGESVYILQIGDSRAYLLRDYDLKQITTDHSYVQELVEKGYITEEEAAHHPDKNKITRALGTGSFVNADIYTSSVAAGGSAAALFRRAEQYAFQSGDPKDHVLIAGLRKVRGNVSGKSAGGRRKG